jgi:uncharacterized protein YlbG (UPF0298 family)
MKNTFLVVTTDIDRLRKHGVITYQSKYSRFVGFETNKSLERVKKIGGVVSAEVARTGHLCA